MQMCECCLQIRDNVNPVLQISVYGSHSGSVLAVLVEFRLEIIDFCFSELLIIQKTKTLLSAPRWNAQFVVDYVASSLEMPQEYWPVSGTVK